MRKKRDDKTAAEKFLAAVVDLTKELEIPTLEEYGIDRAKFMDSIDKMTEDAMASGSPGNTMREVTAEDVKEIRVVSLVCGEKGPIPIESLDEAQREAFSRWLRETYLTELYRGKADVQWDENPASK